MVEAAIRCDGLVKRYGEVLAVDGIDLEVRSGECFGLLGPNGAGKTTTVEVLEGLLAPDAGAVEVLGGDWRHDFASLRERVGIQLQETRLNEKLTVRETLVLFRSFYREGVDPDALLPWVQALPLTAVNDALRAVMLDGASLTQLLGEIAIIGAWGLGAFGAALWWFRWD